MVFAFATLGSMVGSQPVKTLIGCTLGLMLALNATEAFPRDEVGALNLYPFLNNTGPNLLGLLTLTYVPNYFDILPMYLVILALIPAFLGENLNTQTVVPFFTAIAAAVEQWEPRFRIIQIVPESVGRDGRLQVHMEGEYRPRALLGDFTPEGARRVTVVGGTTGSMRARWRDSVSRWCWAKARNSGSRVTARMPR